MAQIAALAAQLDPHGQAAGLGVGMPAAVSPQTLELSHIPNIAGVEGTAFAEILQATFAVPVAIENDVNAAALGEAWLGRTGDPLVLLSLGTGTGMGVVIRGRLFRGHHGAAGEVAYLPIGARSADAADYRDGVFEQRLGGAGWLAAYHAAGGERTDGLAALFARPDAVFAQVLDESAQILAQGILAVAAVMDPQTVLLGGSIGLQESLLAATQRHLRAYGSPIVPAHAQLGQYAGALGAARAAMLTEE